jgi:hypothetical protein
LGIELCDGGVKTLRLCGERGYNSVQVGLAVLEAVDEGGRGRGSVGYVRGMDGLAALEGAYEICVLLHDEIDHVALLFCSAGPEFELAFPCFGCFFARTGASGEFVRAICSVLCSGELAARECQLGGALEEGVLRESDLVGDASEGEGEFLYLRDGKVWCCVWVCTEGVELVGEAGVVLFEGGDVFVDARCIECVTLQLDRCCVRLMLEWILASQSRQRLIKLAWKRAAVSRRLLSSTTMGWSSSMC